MACCNTEGANGRNDSCRLIFALRMVFMSARRGSHTIERLPSARRPHSIRPAKAELKGLMPEDAKEAIGHGIRAKRSKTGAVSFELLNVEGAHHAPLQ